MNTLNNINYNPDILNCLSSLSNDEVFTPPKVVHQMLDMLPAEIWQTQEAAFLDPCTKSGIFLREIVKRLVVGLKPAIPNLEERVNHILHRQVFGIAVTELTALLARRTVYCSKKANAELSIARLATAQGNIIFNGTKHWWNKDGQCKYCGANQQQYDRGDGLEAHAYEFIHTKEPQNLFINAEGKPVKFDVIIGNPPYQMADGGAQASAKPLYHKFIQQAKKLKPRYLSMIVPARWYAGGKGLDAFRNEMLCDNSITTLADFPISKDCFNGVDFEGGVCYFLWDREHSHKSQSVNVITMGKDAVKSQMQRPLLENGMDTFIRFNESISIYHKVKSFHEDSFARLVSEQKPFGLRTFFRGKESQSAENNITIYTTKSLGYVNKSDICKNQDWVNQYKIYVSRVYGERGIFPAWITGKPIFGDKNTCCSETYLVVGPFADEQTAHNVQIYMQTKFLRFMVMLKKISQDAPQRVYECVPMQDFSKPYTDQELYKKYGLDTKEIAFIEAMIKPMQAQ